MNEPNTSTQLTDAQQAQLIVDDSIETLVELESDQDLPSEEETLLARIPLLAGSSKKAAYLAYRSVGFPITKAADLADTTIQTVHKWRKIDPVFKRIEEEELQRLQDTVGYDVIKFEFMRNMRMLLHKDMTLIGKAFNDLESMTHREWELYKALRKFYTANEMLTIEKIINPEKHKDNSPVKIVLTWGNRLPQTQLGNDEMDILDAEVREIDLVGEAN